MKKVALIAVLAAVVMVSGCAQLAQKGGVMGAIQTADEALAAKYGVPKSAVVSVRKALGIPDARTLPASNEVLPKGFIWKYDLLDSAGHVVDPASFHWGTFPVVVPASNVAPTVFSPAVPQVDTLDGILKLLKDNPELLKEVP